MPPKVEYSITEYGQRMTPSLQAMNDWGEGHIDHLNELYGEDSTTEPPERSQQNRR
ncbi:winged helix-turn-helix transcriptional regulator [Paenibacillus sp. FSL W7-1088]|uniref:winged helix-turn-helix transcriptional regulator n=1 Tax=Paenibacillus sp. FSL W7-1088 TaxID=2921695 RepID=UPI0030ECE3CE